MAKKAYIGVNGVARKIKTPYVGVANVARKVKAGYVGVNNVARQFLQAGTPLGSLAVGSTLKLNVNGVAKEFLVAHQGKPGSMYDDSCNGTWLLMKDAYTKMALASSNTNDYAASSIHSYLNGTFVGLLDANIQSIVKTVKIPYRPGSSNSSTTVYSGSNGLSAKAFLLSYQEVGFTDRSPIPNDGSKLDFFIKGTTDEANAKRIAYLDGSTCDWRLRTPQLGTTSVTMYTIKVSEDGTSGGGTQYYSQYGIRPCIILPSTALIDDSGNIIV